MIFKDFFIKRKFQRHCCKLCMKLFKWWGRGSLKHSLTVLDAIKLFSITCLLLHQPCRWDGGLLWCLLWKKTPDIPPAPEFKYLYEHQTAKSAPHSCILSCILPTAWARSHPILISRSTATLYNQNKYIEI